MKKIIISIIIILLLSSSFIGSISAVESFEQPQEPLRQPAEYEPMEGVLIRYPFGIPYDLIAEMSEDVEVITIVASQSEADYVESQYSTNGVDTDHTSYLIGPSDSYWTRDYGPWFVFDGNNELSVIDFTYNRPRPNDNAIPSLFASDQSMNCYLMPLEHAGGNYMTDGQGISVSTDLVYTENSEYTASEIDQIVNDYLGIDTYHVVDDALGEYIEHIDCWAKYLSPDTIMIIEVSQSHSNYDEIEDAVDYFESQTNCYGTPYTIERVYCHLDEPYINCLILNDKVLVPTTGSEWDDEAINSFQQAMPGYEVLGFHGSWQNTDALHCRTKGIPDRDMLYIEHTPISGEQNTEDGIIVSAKIVAFSDEMLLKTQVKYKVDDQSWQTLDMTNVNGNEYQATIPSVSHESIVNYYIAAMDDSGRSEKHPYIGSADAHTFISVNPNAPSKPSKPSGPDSGMVEEMLAFSTSASDPNSDQIQYGWDWNEDNEVDEWTDFYNSEESISITHKWTESGSYSIQVKARDETNYSSGFSLKTKVNIYENQPPNVPTNPYPIDGAQNVDIDIILNWTGRDPDNDDLVYDVFFGTDENLSLVSDDLNTSYYDPENLSYDMTYYWKIVAKDTYSEETEGPIWSFTTLVSNDPPNPPIISGTNNGKAGVSYDYQFTVNDPQNDDIYLFVEWGDETGTGWIGPYESDESFILSHSWDEKGEYTIKAKAKDSFEEEGEWGYLEVSMPKTHFYYFLQYFLSQFPIIQFIITMIDY